MIMTPQLYMYQPVDLPTDREATWEDMCRLAQYDPAARHAVVMVERGDWTREQALIRLAFASYKARCQQFHADVERLNTTVPDFVMVGGKRYDRSL